MTESVPRGDRFVAFDEFASELRAITDGLLKSTVATEDLDKVWEKAKSFNLPEDLYCKLSGLSTKSPAFRTNNRQVYIKLVDDAIARARPTESRLESKQREILENRKRDTIETTFSKESTFVTRIENAEICVFHPDLQNLVHSDRVKVWVVSTSRIKVVQGLSVGTQSDVPEGVAKTAVESWKRWQKRYTRTSHCWKCRRYLDYRDNDICEQCSWMKCKGCDACRCNHPSGPRKIELRPPLPPKNGGSAVG